MNDFKDKLMNECKKSLMIHMYNGKANQVLVRWYRINYLNLQKD